MQFSRKLNHYNLPRPIANMSSGHCQSIALVHCLGKSAIFDPSRVGIVFFGNCYGSQRKFPFDALAAAPGHVA